MARNSRFMQTPEAAVHRAVDALGGLQEVGVELRPEYDGTPDTAGRWLSACLNDEKRDKLSLRQLVRIFHRACLEGQHEGFEAFAALCGYEAKPYAPAAALLDAYRKAEATKREAETAAAGLRNLIDDPRLLATLRAAGVNVEALA